MTKQLEISDIQNLVPICSLTYENQLELIRSVSMRSLGAGGVLLRKGQEDNKTYYLLDGEIEFLQDNRVKAVCAAGSSEALRPIANKQPRNATLVAKTDIRYIAVENDLMDMLLTWDQASSYVVTELDNSNEIDSDADNDWMTKILCSDIFMRIPPANIQKMFMRLEHLSARKGEVIVRQGEKGDYYYILQRGQAEVVRASAEGGKSIRLAVLGPGDHFGEEALISDTVRNATVRMLTEGSLMRMSQQDFNELLKEPVLDEVDYEEACRLVNEGAVWLDVRLENEREGSLLKDSLNIPLYLLRLRIAKLDPQKKYIVCCDTGRRSATAAYLLSQKGFDVLVLAGGMAALPQEESAA